MKTSKIDWWHAMTLAAATAIVLIDLFACLVFVWLAYKDMILPIRPHMVAICGIVISTIMIYALYNDTRKLVILWRK